MSPIVNRVLKPVLSTVCLILLVAVGSGCGQDSGRKAPAGVSGAAGTGSTPVNAGKTK